MNLPEIVFFYSIDFGIFFYIAVTDMTMFEEDCGRTLELLRRRIIDGSELCRMFFSIFKDANMEINAEDEGLTCIVSEGNLKTLSRPFGILN